MINLNLKLNNKNYQISFLIDEKYINNIKIIKDLDYYYLDYKNVRPDYVKAILNNSINWSFVSDQLK